MKRLILACIFMLSAVSSVLAVEAGYHLVAGKTDKAPQLTGNMDEAVWDAFPVLKDFRLLNSDALSELKSHVQVCYDDEALYVRCIAFDPELFERTNSFPADNSIELFVVPSDNNRDNLLQLIVSPVGKASYARFGTRNLADSEYKVKGKISFQDYFIVDFRVPFMLLGKLPKQGDCWKLGVARNTRKKKGWIYSSLTPAQNLFADVPKFVRLEFPKAAVSQNLEKKLAMEWQKEYEFLRNDVVRICGELQKHEKDLQRLHLAESYRDLQQKVRENTRESGSRLRQNRHLRTLLKQAGTLYYHFRLRMLVSPASDNE